MTIYVPPLAIQNFIDKKGPVVGAAWLNAIDNILQGNVPATGVYNPSFFSGQVQVTGPGGFLASYGDLTFGLSIPGPSPFGPAPTLIIGGAGKSTAQITTDAQIPGLAGINLYIAAGSSDPSGTTTGGTLWDFAGSSFGGRGGDRKVQAGTSVHGPGGDVYLFGGNNSNADAPAGNIYMIAGTTGNTGGGIKMYATKLNGNAGDISFWLGQPDIPHSVPLWTMSHTGALFPGNSGAGNVDDFVNCIPAPVLVSGGNLASPTWKAPGLAGNFLVTLSGAMSNNPVTVCNCQTDGRFVLIEIGPSAVTGLPTGPDDIIVSTLPVGLRPSSVRVVPCAHLVNGGTMTAFGQAVIDTFGGITLQIATIVAGIVQIVPNSWSLAGNKGVGGGWSIMYAL